jgi:hypothetical protein
MTRLASVLRDDDLPYAELCAARLDGEVVAVDDCFAPIDVVLSPDARARAAARDWSSRLIAERRSAAWIWGALAEPPAPHELCASIAARARPPTPARAVVREVAIDADEYVSIGGVRVTTPLRTVADLARFSDDFDRDASAVSLLLGLGGLTLDECRAALDRRRNLPGKRRAWQRLVEAAGG